MSGKFIEQITNKIDPSMLGLVNSTLSISVFFFNSKKKKRREREKDCQQNYVWNRNMI